MYSEVRESKPFTLTKYLIMVSVSFVQSIILYFFAYAGSYLNTYDSSGKVKILLKLDARILGFECWDIY